MSETGKRGCRSGLRNQEHEVAQPNPEIYERVNLSMVVAEEQPR